MALNAEIMHQYITAAYDQFSQDLNYPFNFLREALRLNPVPKNFTDHILNFILATYKGSSNIGVGADTSHLRRLNRPLASYMVLAAARRNLQGK